MTALKNPVLKVRFRTTHPMKHDSVTPYNSGENKKEQVANMFDKVARRYDFLNSLLSLGIHKGWRKKCVRMLHDIHPSHILDVATGTADFAIECMALHPQKITGIDISTGMLEIGRKKIRTNGFEQTIDLQEGDAENVQLPDNSFDAIVVGFGVRNFQNLEKGLTNLYRMLRPGGRLIILEFSYPTNPIIKAGYNFYFSYITPLIGRIFSKDPRAYTYLTESVKAFPHNQQFLTIMEQLGFLNCSLKSLSMGVACIYKGEKQ